MMCLKLLGAKRMAFLYEIKPVEILIIGMLWSSIDATAGPKVSGAVVNANVIKDAFNSAVGASQATTSSVNVAGESDLGEGGLILNDSLVDKSNNSAEINSRSLLGSVELDDSELKESIINNILVEESENTSDSGSTAILASIEVRGSNLGSRSTVRNGIHELKDANNVASDNSLSNMSSVQISGLRNTRDMSILNSENAIQSSINFAKTDSITNMGAVQLIDGRTDGNIHNVRNTLYTANNTAENASVANIASILLNVVTRLQQGANVVKTSEPPYIRYLISGDIQNSFELDAVTNHSEDNSISNLGSIDIFTADVTGSIHNAGETSNSANSGKNYSLTNTGSVIIGR